MPFILNAQTPVIRHLLVDTAGESIDFGQRMGAVYIVNMGPTDVYLSFDGIPASAAMANGIFKLPALSMALNLDDIIYQTVGFITAASSADVQVIGTVRGA